MYQTHFGLREAPFSLTPDTEYYISLPPHHQALMTLLVALRSGEGFIKVTGEVGTGKTLLCRKLLGTLETDFTTAWIPNPVLTPAALRMALADELGIEYPRNLGQHRLLNRITDHLLAEAEQGRRVVLLIDEAQSMPNETLEALRLLTNLETEKSKLLQVVLFGQPELDWVLSQPKIRQLKQRISFNAELRPINSDELHTYLQHRLHIAGHQGESLFDKSAERFLFAQSGGILRRIHILAHKAMLLAYGRGDQQIHKHHVQAAVADDESHDTKVEHMPRTIAALLALSASIYWSNAA